MLGALVRVLPGKVSRTLQVSKRAAAAWQRAGAGFVRVLQQTGRMPALRALGRGSQRPGHRVCRRVHASHHHSTTVRHQLLPRPQLPCAADQRSAASPAQWRPQCIHHRASSLCAPSAFGTSTASACIWTSGCRGYATVPGFIYMPMKKWKQSWVSSCSWWMLGCAWRIMWWRSGSVRRDHAVAQLRHALRHLTMQALHLCLAPPFCR